MNDKKLAIIGLRYVVPPLAFKFGMPRPVAGFDINLIALAQQYLAAILRPQVA